MISYATLETHIEAWQCERPLSQEFQNSSTEIHKKKTYML